MSLRRDVLCTVGAVDPEGVLELMGPGLMVYVTEETERVGGVELKLGHKVLVDYRYRAGAPKQIAQRVRKLGYDAEDLARFTHFEATLKAAGLEPEVRFGDAAAYLEGRWKVGAANGELPVDPLREFDRLMSAAGRRFPQTWWHDQPDAGIDEMVDEFLVPRGLGENFPAEAILEDYERRMEEEVPESSATLQHEQLVRRYTAGKIAAEANRLLAEAGRAERFFPFADYAWEDEEPVWYLLTGSQREGLLGGGALKPPGEVERGFSPVSETPMFVAPDASREGLEAPVVHTAPEAGVRPEHPPSGEAADSREAAPSRVEPRPTSSRISDFVLGTAAVGFIALGASGFGSGYFAAAAGVAALWLGRFWARRRK